MRLYASEEAEETDDHYLVPFLLYPLTRPKFDVSKLYELHGGAANVGSEDKGAKVKSGEFKEPTPLASV